MYYTRVIGDARYGGPQHNGDESETMMSDV